VGDSLLSIFSLLLFLLCHLPPIFSAIFIPHILSVLNDFASYTFRFPTLLFSSLLFSSLLSPPIQSPYWSTLPVYVSFPYSPSSSSSLSSRTLFWYLISAVTFPSPTFTS
jgi:hypothetical protein